MTGQDGPAGRGLVYTAVTSRSWWLGVLALLAAVLVLAPVLYFAALLTHVRLRRHPDALAAAVIAIPSLVAAAGAVLVIHAVGGWGGYLAAWSLLFVHQTVTLGALAAVLLAGAVAGPAAGAAWWRADQWHRERQLVGGEASQREREAHESARRAAKLRRDQEARHTAGKRKGMGTGTPAGPYLGVIQSLRGLDWGRTGRVCQMPAGKVTHLVILGASGSGKSELVHRVAEWEIEHTTRQVAYINCKEPVPGDEPSRRLIAAAAAKGKTGKVLVAGSSPYDAFRGTDDEIRQRLLSAELFTEPFYRHGSTVLLALALGMLRGTGEAATGLPDVLRMLCDQTRMVNLAHGGNQLAAQVLEHVDGKSWSGTVTRYASNALTLAQWTGPGAAGGWSFEDGDVLCWDLPTSTEPDAARMLLRWTLTDLFAYLTGPRRPRSKADGRPRPLTVILEELSALDDDPIVMRQVVNAMERGRAARVRFVIVAQGPSGLGDQRTQDAVLTNGTVISFRQVSEAQRVTDLAGTRTRLEASGSYEGHGAHGWDRGSVREQETYKVSPNEVRGLDTGDAFVIHHGNAARITVGLPAGAYGQPPPPDWLDKLRPVGPAQLQPPVEGVNVKQKTRPGTTVPAGPTEPNREERNDL